MLYAFLILSLPGGIRRATSLYEMSTIGLPIVYTYSYYFSALEIPIILIGLLRYRHSNIFRFAKVFIAILILNIVYALMGVHLNVVSNKSYECFLLLLTGFSAASYVLYAAKDLNELDKIIDWFAILQFASILVSMITGTSGEGGRYSAIGMGAGATASLATSYLIWAIFSRSTKPWIIPIICSVVTVIMTGSRANLLVFPFILVVFSGKAIQRQYKRGNKKPLLLLIALGIPLLTVATLFLSTKGGLASLERVLSLFEGNFFNNVTTDSSFLGRLRTIDGSLRILREHPFGIPFSIYTIEYYSAYTFSMEYPHSTLLSYILLWSPLIAIACFVYLIVLMVKCFRKKMDDAIYLVYFLMVSIFYGSPILYAKTYAFIFIIISYISFKEKNNVDLIKCIKGNQQI